MMGKFNFTVCLPLVIALASPSSSPFRSKKKENLRKSMREKQNNDDRMLKLIIFCSSSSFFHYFLSQCTKGGQIIDSKLKKHLRLSARVIEENFSTLECRKTQKKLFWGGKFLAELINSLSLPSQDGQKRDLCDFSSFFTIRHCTVFFCFSLFVVFIRTTATTTR